MPLPHASWIWLPDDRSNGKATRFLQFRLSLNLNQPENAYTLRVSADQRFQLWLDGERLGEGPDRSDLNHWCLHTFSGTLPAGLHELRALVWHIAEDPATLSGGRVENSEPVVTPPMAQISWRGGFYMEAAAGDVCLDTGEADWQVADLTDAVSLSRKDGLIYHDIGPAFEVDMRKWSAPAAELPATVCVGPEDAVSALFGVLRPGWKLTPTTLPPQRHEVFTGGTFRGDALSLPLTVPPNTEQTWIWDTDTYLCGYPDLAWSGGKGSRISVEWAETLYHAPESGPLTAQSLKGNRDEVEGKSWLGFGDTFHASGANDTSPGLWWRSGRYLRIHVKTATTPLRLEKVAVYGSRYPYDADDIWHSDPEWDHLLGLCRKTIEACAHETWVDCPYYEQLMYVADTRLHMLIGYTGYRDDRLSRRCMDLLNASRQGSSTNLVAQRYPSAWRQESGTFAMIYIWMLRDHLYWRDDSEFVKSHLSGMRQLLAAMRAFCLPDGRMGAVPGWPFVDWVEEWDKGCGPGVREGDSSLLSLQWIHTLKAASQVEEAAGDPELASLCMREANRCMEATLSRYWSPDKQLLLDSTDVSAMTSEHAQVLALLTRMVPPDKEQAMLEALEECVPTCTCTYYYRAYLLEVFYQFGRGEAFHRLLAEWRDFPKHGFRTLPEKPEPTRSDCHAWSAHPLFHSHASIAGIRPAAPGFSTVTVRPMPGPFTSFESVVPHPRGEIRVTYNNGKLDISVPDGVKLLTPDQH